MHYFLMSKWLLALLFLATPALAQQEPASEQPTAYQALRVVGTQLKRDYVNHVISVTGINGNPQPDTWRVMIEDPQARGGVREVEVAQGRINSERTPLRSAVEGSLGPTIDTSKLNLDSSGAFTMAQQTAEKSHINFATADYTLSSDARGNPIWALVLHRPDGEQTGTIHIGANQGNIVRTEGLFSGKDRNAVVDESTPDDQEGDADTDEDDDGDQNIVKRRIKAAFRQARDEVKASFYRVRRSFVDFFREK